MLPTLVDRGVRLVAEGEVAANATSATTPCITRLQEAREGERRLCDRYRVCVVDGIRTLYADRVIHTQYSTVGALPPAESVAGGWPRASSHAKKSAAVLDRAVAPVASVKLVPVASSRGWSHRKKPAAAFGDEEGAEVKSAPLTSSDGCPCVGAPSASARSRLEEGGRCSGKRACASPSARAPSGESRSGPESRRGLLSTGPSTRRSDVLLATAPTDASPSGAAGLSTRRSDVLL
eukprot:CAMPEP_0119366714 /NCGR_PEP_ID=MMETSP1334-20130426/13555_1 /TAXON_ID=127549 /ORGANISM="Calcidiscus leptoporus, Strain RCC1130" /LENGTH=234 /DNA_ID=CAMNT_0007382977 /DNA_START=42 /DNA_END=743 /DNA_ORIENTATION=-